MLIYFKVVRQADHDDLLSVVQILFCKKVIRLLKIFLAADSQI